MGKYKSKRLSICLTPDQYDRVKALGKLMGATTMSKAVAAIVRAMLRLVDGEGEAATDPEPSEISQMFAEISDWEPRPEPGHAPKRRRQRNG